VLQVAPSTYYAAKTRAPSTRTVRDGVLRPALRQLWADNYCVYGARKLWKAAARAGWEVGRDQVARLMRAEGLEGARRTKRVRTTKADPAAARHPDLVRRDFTADAPNRLWVTDLTYVPTWAGIAYAFVIDAYARRIIGWRSATSMTSQLVLDAIEHAVWTRGRDGRQVSGVIHHHDHGSQNTSVAVSERLAADGIRPSMGVVGSSYDNALAETINGLYKTELIKARGPLRTIDQVEVATAEWVDWFNHRRLYEYCGDIPPAQMEAAYYAHHETQTTAAVSN